MFCNSVSIYLKIRGNAYFNLQTAKLYVYIETLSNLFNGLGIFWVILLQKKIQT